MQVALENGWPNVIFKTDSLRRFVTLLLPFPCAGCNGLAKSEKRGQMLSLNLLEIKWFSSGEWGYSVCTCGGTPISGYKWH